LRIKSDWKTTPTSCIVCGTLFLRQTHWGTRHCSIGCLRAHNTSRHAEYVAKNRTRVRQYEVSWKHALWGLSSPRIAKRAEVVAVTSILPKIGFTDLVNVAASRRYVPFDVVGTFGGSRVLVDVTTGCWKGGKYLESASSFAGALGMKLFILFVKPDLRRFALKPVDKGRGIYCSLHDLRALRQ